jgi:hypothetical protein
VYPDGCASAGNLEALHRESGEHVVALEKLRHARLLPEHPLEWSRTADSGAQLGPEAATRMSRAIRSPHSR